MLKNINCRQFKLAILAHEHPLWALQAFMKIPQLMFYGLFAA
jgi:hypothetical protein